MATPPLAAPSTAHWTRQFRWRLAAITALGAAWRLGYLWVVKRNQQLLLNDSLYYSIQAGLNSEGSWFKDALTGQPGAEHGMLTSLYLTPWSLGDGDNVFRQRFAMTLCGIVTVALIGLAARRLVALGAGRQHGRRTASGSSPPASRPSTRISGSTTRS